MTKVIAHNNLIDEIILRNEEMEVHLLNLGATIKNIYVSDAQKHIRDVVLGYGDVFDYMRYDGYLGASVGRCANRIAKGRFTLDGKTYHLPINNGPHSLHGGLKGFSYRLFDYIYTNHQVTFHYLSPDGQEGYPGTLDVYVTYTLDKTTLTMDYQAVTSQTTLVNLTNHTYFNLDGIACPIDDHLLTVKASHYALVDGDGLVTGEIRDIHHTPFDFTKEKAIGEALHSDDPQIILARGLDHPFLFDDNHDQVILRSKASGITMKVSTSLPLAQIYSANYLDGRLGKHKYPMNAQSALCIETSYLPDSIHLEKDSPTILKPGESYQASTSYTFTHEG
ncbi:aldose 1-epimerase [Intestinibaculum porci]|uniref:Aldose 1-epimerase n=1 Tax=Intestinibaculum porci TaxID=2487118 RepID=A0A3G9J2X2_9FIRM|nr:aldose epimerase family protein [Intestinibaculum porci]BBH25510.1 aldose 1-epimerase [Intestinibaculum porci]